MNAWRQLALSALVALGPFAHAQGQAANFPSRPIRILVPFNAGSGADSSSRFYGDLMGKAFGQQVLVENKPGGSGVLAVQATRQAAADGHTILMGSNSPAVVNAIMMKNLPYDPFKDLRPLYGISMTPVAFAVKADSPYKTIGDLVAAAKKANRPLQLGNYSAGYQLVAAWLGTASGVPVTHIPYKGGAQMLTDVVGGQLEVGVIDFGGTLELMKGGRLRVLAITGDKRDPKFADIPTMKESGFADFEVTAWYALVAQAALPKAIASALNAASVRALRSPEVAERFAAQGVQPVGSSEAELDAFLRNEIAKWDKIIRAARITG